MYVVAMAIFLDLEPEVTAADRSKVLRRVRNHLRNHYSNRMTAQTDDDCAIVLTFVDDNYSRMQSRIEEILEAVESFSEARIADHTEQIYALYEGQFHETKTEIESDIYQLNAESPRHTLAAKTIRYHDDDLDEEDFSKIAPLPTRFSKKNVRLPARK